MKRFIEFDMLRGVLLLMMSVDHSPSSLRRFTDQPLGFFSTAECFMFVSAFLAGMLFRKRAEKLGCAATRPLQFTGLDASTGHTSSLFPLHLFLAGFSDPSFLALEIC
jgi:OpgC protein